MKAISTPKFLALAAFSSLIFTSCKKEQTPVAVATGDESSVIEQQDATSTIVTFRPGLKDGQDTYVSKIDNDPNDGNTNLNFTKEILASKFYYYGQLATQRGYIKFDSLLYRIPSTANIISAKLFLYGETSSISFPYGNSYYTGSGNPANPCYIQRVVGKNWTESSLNWNNKPNTTTIDQVTLPASTSQWSYDASVDVTAIVKTMLSLGKNYGFCMRQITEESYRVLLFSSSESTDVTKRPRLVVRYN